MKGERAGEKGELQNPFLQFYQTPAEKASQDSFLGSTVMMPPKPLSHKGYTWQTLEDFEWERAPRCHEYGECCFRNHGKCTALSDTNFEYGFCTFRKSSPDGENLYDKGAFEYDRS